MPLFKTSQLTFCFFVFGLVWDFETESGCVSVAGLALEMTLLPLKSAGIIGVRHHGQLQLGCLLI